MKKYVTPDFEIIEISNDLITTSLGTETTPKDDNDGDWELIVG